MDTASVHQARGVQRVALPYASTDHMHMQLLLSVYMVLRLLLKVSARFANV